MYRPILGRVLPPVRIKCDLHHNFCRRCSGTVPPIEATQPRGREMQFLRKWFGESPGDEDSAEHEEAERFSARAEALRQSQASDEYHNDTSFAWNALESCSSSIFDTPARRIVLEENSSEEDRQDDEDTGYDPYDTGRFV